MVKIPENRQYEIRMNNLRYQVFERRRILRRFIALGIVKWTKWYHVGVFEKEKHAVEFIKIMLKKQEKYNHEKKENV